MQLQFLTVFIIYILSLIMFHDDVVERALDRRLGFGQNFAIK